MGSQNHHTIRSNDRYRDGSAVGWRKTQVDDGMAQGNNVYRMGIPKHCRTVPREF